MAVVNQYKFYGKATTAAETVSMLSPAVNETLIIKSLRVTNKSGSNTPTISITNRTPKIKKVANARKTKAATCSFNPQALQEKSEEFRQNFVAHFSHFLPAKE